MSIYYATIRSLPAKIVQKFRGKAYKDVSYYAVPQLYNAGNDYATIANRFVQTALKEIPDLGVNDNGQVYNLQFGNDTLRACHYSYDKSFLYLCIHGSGLDVDIYTDFLHALMKRDIDEDTSLMKNELEHYMDAFQEKGHYDKADWRVPHETLLLTKKNRQKKKTVFQFMQLCQNFPNYPEGYHDSYTAVDIQLSEGISRQDYRLFQSNLDPTLDTRYADAKSWNCFRCSCCSFSKSRCGCPYPSGCCGCGIGLPNPCIYFILFMYICLIAFLLETDFAALVYFLSRGSLFSDNPVEKVVSTYSLGSFLICYLALFFTLDQCAMCYCGSSDDTSMWSEDVELGAESTKQDEDEKTCDPRKPCLRFACPSMTLGPADARHEFESTAARLQSLRIRWFMLTPFARMLFIVIAFGNVDWKLRSKSADHLRQEKITAFRAIAVLGMVNCLTLTIPNIAIASLNIFYSNEDENTLDMIFFGSNCLSLLTTIMSMCFGVLNAVVYKIDSMDSILNDVAETQDRQLKISKYAKSHLKDLNELNQEIYLNLALSENTYSGNAQNDDNYMAKMGARISNWESFASKLLTFVPEDQKMHALKVQLLEETGRLCTFASDGDFADNSDSKEEVQKSYKKLEVLCWKLQGRVRAAAINYAEDLKVACRITKTNFKAIAGEFKPFLEDYKTLNRHALRAATSYSWGVDKTLITDHGGSKFNCKSKKRS